MKKFSHGDWTAHAAWVSSGKIIVSAGADNVVRSWSAKGAVLHELKEPRYSGVCGVQRRGSRSTKEALARRHIGLDVDFSPDGKQLMFAGPAALGFVKVS